LAAMVTKLVTKVVLKSTIASVNVR